MSKALKDSSTSEPSVSSLSCLNCLVEFGRFLAVEAANAEAKIVAAERNTAAEAGRMLLNTVAKVLEAVEKKAALEMLE